MSSSPQVALITGWSTILTNCENERTNMHGLGGADGFGAAIADRYSKEGCKVIFIDLNREKGEQRARADSNLHFIRGDVSRRETWEEALEYGRQMFGRLDIVVNNAGGVIIPHCRQRCAVTNMRNTGITFDPLVRRCGRSSARC